MLWVLKRTVSMRRYPKHMLELMGKKILTFLRSKTYAVCLYKVHADNWNPMSQLDRNGYMH